MFAAASTWAAELEIVSCIARSPHIDKLYIQLLVSDEGRFIGRYTLGHYPTYQPSSVNFQETTTPPVSMPKLVKQINQFRDTGLDASKIKKFQNVFIDGSGSWDIELWKLMDESGRTLGWTAYAFGEPMGCYPN